MLRSDILRGVYTVLHSLVVSGLGSQFTTITEPRQQGPVSPDLMRASHAFRTESTKFGPVEHRILDIFHLDDLLKPDWWFIIFTEDADVSTQLLMNMRRKLRFATEYLPDLLELLGNEATSWEQPATEGSTQSRGLELLELVLVESAHESSRPARLINAIGSIDALFQAIVRIYNLPDEQLRVVGCDSGSDKKFDFLGIAEGIAGVKDIIISVWDRVVFHRERQFEARLQLVVESLPIVEKLKDMEAKSQMTPEECEMLKRGVIMGIKKFLESGCTIPELDEHRTVDPRRLLAPSPKLLAPAPDAPVSDPKAPPSNLDNPSSTLAAQENDAADDINLAELTDDERTLIARMLQERRGASGPTRKGG